MDEVLSVESDSLLVSSSGDEVGLLLRGRRRLTSVRRVGRFCFRLIRDSRPISDIPEEVGIPFGGFRDEHNFRHW